MARLPLIHGRIPQQLEVSRANAAANSVVAAHRAASRERHDNAATYYVLAAVAGAACGLAILFV